MMTVGEVMVTPSKTAMLGPLPVGVAVMVERLKPPSPPPHWFVLFLLGASSTGQYMRRAWEAAMAQGMQEATGGAEHGGEESSVGEGFRVRELSQFSMSG